MFGVELPFPFTPGLEISGIVDSIGEEVTSFNIGDRVQVFNWDPIITPTSNVCGGYAEYLLAPESKVVKIPEHVDLQVAAAMPTVALTAYQVITQALQVQAGNKLLILGGSSAVGCIAIQIAKFLGAEVFTTCSSRGLPFVEQFRPDHIIDYTVNDWDEILHGKDFDAVFDCVGERGAFERAKTILKANGSFATLVNPSIGLDPHAHQPLRYAAYYRVQPNIDQQKALLDYVNEGLLKIPIEDIFHFTDDGVRNALLKTLGGKSLGKNIIRMDEHV